MLDHDKKTALHHRRTQHTRSLLLSIGQQEQSDREIRALGLVFG